LEMQTDNKSTDDDQCEIAIYDGPRDSHELCIWKGTVNELSGKLQKANSTISTTSFQVFILRALTC